MEFVIFVSQFEARTGSYIEHPNLEPGSESRDADLTRQHHKGKGPGPEAHSGQQDLKVAPAGSRPYAPPLADHSGWVVG